MLQMDFIHLCIASVGLSDLRGCASSSISQKRLRTEGPAKLTIFEQMRGQPFPFISLRGSHFMLSFLCCLDLVSLLFVGRQCPPFNATIVSEYFSGMKPFATFRTSINSIPIRNNIVLITPDLTTSNGHNNVGWAKRSVPIISIIPMIYRVCGVCPCLTFFKVSQEPTCPLYLPPLLSQLSFAVIVLFI